VLVNLIWWEGHSRESMGDVHIGVTPTSGAETPAYRPRRNPSLATLFLTTSMALE
jgi:hypothetical protein